MLEPLRLGLGEAEAESNRLSEVLPSMVKVLVGSDGVVGVAHRDLFVGKGGNGQSCEREIPGDGGRKGVGDVALRGGIRPDFWLKSDVVGDPLGIASLLIAIAL